MSVVRIMIASFGNAQDLVLHSWLRHRNRVVQGQLIGGFATADVVNAETANPTWQVVEPQDFMDDFDVDRVFAWRLLTSNNRELARSAGIFFRFSDAQEDAMRLQQNVSLLMFDAVVDSLEGTQTWRASLAGKPIAFGSRWFRMERDRDRALHNALAILPLAQVAETAQSVGSAR